MGLKRVDRVVESHSGDPGHLAPMVTTFATTIGNAWRYTLSPRLFQHAFALPLGGHPCCGPCSCGSRPLVYEHNCQQGPTVRPTIDHRRTRVSRCRWSRPFGCAAANAITCGQSTPSRKEARSLLAADSEPSESCGAALHVTVEAGG